MPDDKYVLIVEDDDDARLLFKTILVRNHYPVLVAETAEKARKILETHVKRVDAILLDLTLRGEEDGLSLARYLREQEAWKDVPIIAITARMFDHDRGNVFAAGCNAHLAKPVVARDLLDVLSLYVRAETHP
jgi:two-component system, sensor histidine kinase and response regulator